MKLKEAHESLAEGLLTVREACDITRRSLSSVYADMRSGRIRSVKIGRSRRITRAALAKYIAESARDGWQTGAANGDCEPTTKGVDESK